MEIRRYEEERQRPGPVPLRVRLERRRNSLLHEGGVGEESKMGNRKIDTGIRDYRQVNPFMPTRKTKLS